MTEIRLQIQIKKIKKEVDQIKRIILDLQTLKESMKMNKILIKLLNLQVIGLKIWYMALKVFLTPLQNRRDQSWKINNVNKNYKKEKSQFRTQNINWIKIKF